MNALIRIYSMKMVRDECIYRKAFSEPDRTQIMTKPPLRPITCPVMNLALSEAR
jgi:hypothetical protein